ncbi:MAG: DUF4345 family protein [Bacteroidota bacterium]
MKIFYIVVLVLSGLALFYACTMRLINPKGAVFLQTFFENPENSLDNHTDWVSEIRGVGAVMLLGGIVVLLGAVKADFRFTSFVVATVIFTGVVMGRSLSFFLEGVPHPNLIRVAITEGVLAALNIYGLLRLYGTSFEHAQHLG